MTPVVREESVASSSRSYLPKGQGKGKGKGRPGATSPDADQTDQDAEINFEATPVPPKGRGRPKRNNPGSSKAPQYSDDDLSTVISPRQKRARARQSPVPHSVPKVRLRLSSQKGKAKECEEEELHKGLFDDILTEAERETLKTSITAADKQRFERSRIIAEVRCCNLIPDITHFLTRNNLRPLQYLKLLIRKTYPRHPDPHHDLSVPVLTTLLLRPPQPLFSTLPHLHPRRPHPPPLSSLILHPSEYGVYGLDSMKSKRGMMLLSRRNMLQYLMEGFGYVSFV